MKETDTLPINYCSLAMELSSNTFAWHFFGVNNAVHQGQYAPDSSDTIAREYLATFYPEALEQAEGISLETQTLGN